MRALLDINVLIALLDEGHVHHKRAENWFKGQGAGGWASCPLTQNGCVRIMSQPRYPNPLPIVAVVHRLRAATVTPQHEFWPDDVSLLDPQVTDPTRIHSPKQLTDLYLLALAAKHGGCFATFDERIPYSALQNAGPEHLKII